MKFLFLTMMMLVNLFALSSSENKKNFILRDVPKNMSTKYKKERFYALLVVPIHDVYSELQEEYINIQNDLNHSKNFQKIEALKKIYKVHSDKELLMALKPHPPSIVLAQAAMESAWATSRFFTEAKNVFGMWSSNATEQRIAATGKRAGNRTVWLKKFDTIKGSIRAYYKTLARAKEYKKFREYRYENRDVLEMVKGLDKYSEMGQEYVKALRSMITYNKLKKYD